MCMVSIGLLAAGCGAQVESSLAENQPDASSSLSNGVTFSGICDGSAAVKLADDQILVAYDETNTLFGFKTNGGSPTARIDYGSLLNLQSNDEVDLEGAVVEGDRIWWIGSHGLNGDGEEAPNRRLLFATNVPNSSLNTLELTDKPIDLLPILLESSEVANILTDEVLKRKPKEGGLNIEGLAETGTGDLLIGLRSPLSGNDGRSGNALVVQIQPQADTFTVVRTTSLDLGNRGIRDIVRDGDRYQIVAGPVESGGEFALYAWNGTFDIKQTSALKMGFNAEALVDLGESWLILSDDGKVTRQDEEAEDGDRKCDKIRRKNSQGDAHPSVFFQGMSITKMPSP